MTAPRVLWTAPDGDYRLIAAPVGGRPTWIVQFKERMGWEYFQQVPQCVALALIRDQETRDAAAALALEIAAYDAAHPAPWVPS